MVYQPVKVGGTAGELLGLDDLDRTILGRAVGDLWLPVTPNGVAIGEVGGNSGAEAFASRLAKRVVRSRRTVNTGCIICCCTALRTALTIAAFFNSGCGLSCC